jgi:glycolate oxidase iron-sulfur subunit
LTVQTNIAAAYKDTDLGQEADAILRACVHCGFCTATCPTYQLLGDELDGPRGRIYLIKQMLEGQEVGTKTQQHLDRCLTCRSCETTCPSGVQYARLLDMGREIIEEKVGRPFVVSLERRLLRAILPHRGRFAFMLGLARLLRPLLPKRYAGHLPARQTTQHTWPATQHARKVLLLEGCVQSALAPNINLATARVLDKLGINVIRTPNAGCCGALSQHMAASDEAQDMMRRNIDAWWPHVEAGAEAIVINASGCVPMVKDYGYHLRGDSEYAEKAQCISELARDISEIIAPQDVNQLIRTRHTMPIAFHAPCSLQHGLQLDGKVEAILQGVGYILTPVSDSHLCCGAAGTYAILQSELSQRLLSNKLKALQQGQPRLIASANIGCLSHLQSKAEVPVRHWIELLADAE